MELPDESDQESEEGNPLTWKTFLGLVDADTQRSRLMHVPADGKTLHAFIRNESLDWNYMPYDAEVLLEWAITIVLAQRDRRQLGTIH